MPIFGQRGLGKPAIALLVLSAGCGSSPTRPGDSESSNLPLAAGSYVTARDLRSPGGAVTITFAGQGTSPAMLLGGTSTFPIAQVAGEISGSITVTGSLGSGTCPRALWGIRKPEAGEID